MKCHKCNYIGFDHLAACKKCGVDLSQTRSSLGFTDLAPQVPFLLGFLLENAGNAPDGATTGTRPKQEVQEEFAIIDMGDGFDLPAEGPDSSSSRAVGDEPASMSAQGVGEVRVSSADLAEETLELAIHAAKEDAELDLSLSFDDVDEFFPDPEAALIQQTLSSYGQEPPKAQLSSEDSQELVLEGFDDEPPAQMAEPKPAAKAKTQKNSRNQPGKTPEADLVLEEGGILGGDLLEGEGSLGAPDSEEIVSLELEEIDLGDLVLESLDSVDPEAPETPEKVRKKNARTRGGTKR